MLHFRDTGFPVENCLCLGEVAVWVVSTLKSGEVQSSGCSGAGECPPGWHLVLGPGGISSGWLV